MSNRPALRDGIFISYRRDDARGASGRLYDWLRIGYGRDCVFRDVHSIGVGRWRDKIDSALARCAVCVVVIGPRWANADNLPRLHDENDMVRHELVTALSSDAINLVPVLVEGAAIPTAASLPAPLRPLFGLWNVRPVTEDGWEDDTRRLIAEIAEATGLPVQSDLETLLRDASAAQQRIVELEQAQNLQADQVDALRRTVDELRGKLAEASAAERSGLAQAFAALARGDSRGAEDAFEREYDAQNRLTEEARRTMAEAARNVANLALLRDVTKGVTFYRKALAANPEDAETARLLGLALTILGDLPSARTALSESLRIASEKGDAWSEMAAQIGLGDVYLRIGNLPDAKSAFTAALRLCEMPANTEWQCDLSVSHMKNGDVLLAQGGGPEALAAYRKSLVIREALATRDPANTQWQRDLSVSNIKIGDVLLAQDNKPLALAALRKSLATCKALAARNPASTQWQRDLSVSHDKIGDVLVTQGDGPKKALASFGKILVILLPTALDAFRKSLVIREALAARDPANAQWQRDLAVSHEKIGGVLVAQNDGPNALAAFSKGLAICEALAARDSGNAQWQIDLAVSCANLGVLDHGQTLNVRHAHLVRGRNILISLKSDGRLMPSQDWIGWFDEQLAKLAGN